jgi:hypothetical protein
MRCLRGDCYILSGEKVGMISADWVKGNTFYPLFTLFAVTGVPYQLKPAVNNVNKLNKIGNLAT